MDKVIINNNNYIGQYNDQEKLEQLLLTIIDICIKPIDNNDNQKKILMNNIIDKLRETGFIKNTVSYDPTIMQRNKYLIANILGEIFTTSQIKNLLDYNQVINVQHNRYLQEYQEIEQIGSGGFSTVYSARNYLDNNIYAIKKIQLNSISDFNNILKEIQILASFDSAYIIRYYTSWIEICPKTQQHNIQNISTSSANSYLESYDSLTQSTDITDYVSQNPEINQSRELVKYTNMMENILTTDNNYYLYIQMQLCQPTLKVWLETKYDQNIALNIFKQIVYGLSYIHSKNIIHRDLKPSNIFINQTENNYIAKIGDFGLATTHYESKKHTNNCGTLLYAAPEQINSTEYDNRTDIYSLGLILVEILNPFYTDMERSICFEKIKIGRIPKDIKEKIPWKYQELILQMTNKHPSKRPTIQIILNFLTK